MRDFYAELTEYTGRERELVQRRCEYSVYELAYTFNKDDVISTYRDNDLYCFDLTHYQVLLRERGFHQLLVDILKRFNFKKILDFGGGIGEYVLLAIENGIEADFLEVAESETLKYAKWRFKKHGVNPKIFTEKTDLTGMKYDCVVAMDVFEHIENPEPVIKKCAEIARYLWCNPFELPFNWLYPQHISKFDDDLRKYFEVVDRYLWERKDDIIKT